MKSKLTYFFCFAISTVYLVFCLCLIVQEPAEAKIIEEPSKCFTFEEKCNTAHFTRSCVKFENFKESEASGIIVNVREEFLNKKGKKKQNRFLDRTTIQMKEKLLRFRLQKNNKISSMNAAKNMTFLST